MVIVYRFYEAPAKYRELSQHGGDEDYVIIGTDEELVSDIASRLEIYRSQMCLFENEYVAITAHG